MRNIGLCTLLLHTPHALHHRTSQTVPQEHPQLMIEGAFSHAPFDGTSYGFRTKSARYVIPDVDGENHGQSTWVELAMCCAATPISGKSTRDDAHGEAFSPPIADRCLSYSELERGASYKNDVVPKGIPKSSCAAQNIGFYHDLTRDDYHPRHAACCSWFKTFLNDAWSEYPDLASKAIIDRIGQDSNSIYEKAKDAVAAYDRWREHECGNTGQDACCAACLSDSIPNKLAKYVDTTQIKDPITGDTPDGTSNNLCSYFGDGWCGVHESVTAPKAAEESRRQHGIFMSQQNPQIMVDGAYRHRPTQGDLNGGEPGHTYTKEDTNTETYESTLDGKRSKVNHIHVEVHVPIDPDAIPYVTGHGGPELVIPEHTGAVTGQMTWVDIAKCCAATPLEEGGVSSPPSERCVTSTELKTMASEYGKHRGPCKQENLGWFQHVTHANDQPLWEPRYRACCEYMRHFVVNGEKEFSDPPSLRILTSIKAAGRTVVGDESSGSIQSMSVALVQQFELWNKGVCTDAQGASTGRCCYDCLRPTIDKLTRYSGFDSMMTCGHEGEGWCGPGQNVPRSLLEQITTADPVTRALKKTTKQNSKGYQNQEKGGKATLVVDKTKIKISTKSSIGPNDDQKKVKQKSKSKSKTRKNNMIKSEDNRARLMEIDTTSKILEARAERILIDAHSKKRKLNARTLDIVDRAKLTLLSERVDVMKMLKEQREGHSKFAGDMVDQEKEQRFEEANQKLPSLLQNVEDFIQSGQASVLLEEEE
jgi:hypothetical protein